MRIIDDTSEEINIQILQLESFSQKSVYIYIYIYIYIYY